jgi:N-acetylglucosaminyldiphosphoundecaprenol N-acetyl-beta-D-mannosaminyltransferase
MLLPKVIAGELSIVGPVPKCFSNREMRLPEVWMRQQMVPGIFSLFTLKKLTNIAFETERKYDREYFETHSIRRDLGIMVRSVLARLYGISSDVPTDQEVDMLGVRLANLTTPEAVRWVRTAAEGSNPKTRYFVNAHCLNVARKSKAYLLAVNAASLVLPDGIGVKIAGNILKTPLKENTNGTDLFYPLLQCLQREGRSVFFLGGRDGVAGRLVSNVKRDFPCLRVAGYEHGFSSDHDTTCQRIRESCADVLFVAMGVPVQELWLQSHLKKTGARLGIAVGGLFDFYSDCTPRAPVWMRELGMEWCFRLLHDPARLWKRYALGNLSFLLKVFQQRFKNNSQQLRQTVALSGYGLEAYATDRKAALHEQPKDVAPFASLGEGE